MRRSREALLASALGLWWVPGISVPRSLCGTAALGGAILLSGIWSALPPILQLGFQTAYLDSSQPHPKEITLSDPYFDLDLFLDPRLSAVRFPVFRSPMVPIARCPDHQITRFLQPSACLLQPSTPPPAPRFPPNFTQGYPIHPRIGRGSQRLCKVPNTKYRSGQVASR